MALQLFRDDDPGAASPHNEGPVGSDAIGCPEVPFRGDFVVGAMGASQQDPESPSGQGRGDGGFHLRRSAAAVQQHGEEDAQEQQDASGSGEAKGIPEADEAVVLPGQLKDQVDSQRQERPLPGPMRDDAWVGKDLLAKEPGQARQEAIQGQLHSLPHQGAAQESRVYEGLNGVDGRIHGQILAWATLAIGWSFLRTIVTSNKERS